MMDPFELPAEDIKYILISHNLKLIPISLSVSLNCGSFSLADTYIHSYIHSVIESVALQLRSNFKVPRCHTPHALNSVSQCILLNSELYSRAENIFQCVFLVDWWQLLALLLRLSRRVLLAAEQGHLAAVASSSSSSSSSLPGKGLSKLSRTQSLKLSSAQHLHGVVVNEIGGWL